MMEGTRAELEVRLGELGLILESTLKSTPDGIRHVFENDEQRQECESALAEQAAIRAVLSAKIDRDSVSFGTAG
jgi:hypothetical protein